jgi:hypothetical protein
MNRLAGVQRDGFADGHRSNRVDEYGFAHEMQMA